MTSFRKTLAKDWPALLLLLLPFILIALTWNRIPEEIAMHWNLEGEVDRWGEKGFDVFIIPLINIGAYLLLLAVPYIDPKRKAESEQKGLRAFRFIIPLLMTGIFLVILMQWIGIDVQIEKSIYLIVTVVFLVIGNYLQLLKPNYFVGIRTPWTLENEEIWRKTHRLGGKVWVAGSLIMLILWFFVPQSAYYLVFFAGVLSLAIIPVGYSFYLYIQERRSSDTEAV